MSAAPVLTCLLAQLPPTVACGAQPVAGATPRSLLGGGVAAAPKRQLQAAAHLIIDAAACNGRDWGGDLQLGKNGRFNLLWNTPLQLRRGKKIQKSEGAKPRVHASFVKGSDCNCRRATAGPKRPGRGRRRQLLPCQEPPRRGRALSSPAASSSKWSLALFMPACPGR